MVGQERLLKEINKLNLSTFPRTLMLTGAVGSGRHLLCKEIAKRLNLDLVDITNELTLDTITRIMETVEPHIYLIDLAETTIREQNIILKFIEEPLKNAYVIVIKTPELVVLSTTQNRCVEWSMDMYSMSDLRGFFTTDDKEKEYMIWEIARTPGQVIKYQQEPIEEMFALAEKICDNIGRATLPNTLTLTDKIAFKNEKDKFDFDTFMMVLKVVARNKFAQQSVIESFVRKVIDYSYKTFTNNVNKEHIFAGLLIEIREVMRLWNSKN